MKWPKRKKQIKIVYKSGHVEYVKVKTIKIHSREGEITEMEWEDMKPRPLSLGINDIESIWVV